MPERYHFFTADFNSVKRTRTIDEKGGGKRYSAYKDGMVWQHLCTLPISYIHPKRFKVTPDSLCHIHATLKQHFSVLMLRTCFTVDACTLYSVSAWPVAEWPLLRHPRLSQSVQWPPVWSACGSAPWLLKTAWLGMTVPPYHTWKKMTKHTKPWAGEQLRLFKVLW